VVYELQQSKTQAVAKPIILVGHTFLYKTGVCQNFAMTCPETSDMKDVAKRTQLSAGYSYDLFRHMV
jgi:hypothetical protein